MKDQFIPFEELEPFGLFLRFVSNKDVRAITGLIYEVCKAEGDTATALSEEDLQNEWDYAGFDPEKDAFVVANDEGKLVGYAAVYDVDRHCELSGDIYIHPNYDALTIGEALLFAVQQRAERHVPFAPQGEKVFLRVAIDNRNGMIKTLFSNDGYQAVRYHWRMEIELNDTLQPTDLPDGITLRPFDWHEQAQAVWQARNASFTGNWGSRELAFEEFSYYTLENPQYDPSLWQVAWVGDRVAGFCINHMRMGIGWIHILGVIPEWRGKGLGLALLQHSFAAFIQRGINVVGLGVDAANESGATRLYESVGMHVVSEFVTFEKFMN